MEDLPLRFASTVLIFAMGLVGGLIPWWVGRRASHGEHGAHGIDWLSLGNCFAGGVILAAGFVHLLGDAASGYAAAYPQDDFPWPFAIAAASFVSILAIERVLPRIPAGDRSGGDPEAAALVAAAAGGVFPYLLLLTLSIHSLIAGLALGTQTSSSGFAIVLVAILAHKGSAAFALGVSMHRAEIPRRRATPLIAGFAVMTPIGVLAGDPADEPREQRCGSRLRDLVRRDRRGHLHLHRSARHHPRGVHPRAKRPTPAVHRHRRRPAGHDARRDLDLRTRSRTNARGAHGHS